MTETAFMQVSPAELPEILRMYQLAFKPLFDRYHDVETTPYLETLTSLTEKAKQAETEYDFFEVDGCRVGMVRLLAQSATTMRISPLLILPEYQNRGLAKLMLSALENHFPRVTCWQLDTIIEEPKLVHLYQRAGYQQLPDRCEVLQPGMTIGYFEKRL